MIRMKVILSLVLVVSPALVQRAYSQDDIDSALSRAEALYFEARFNESIQLLSPVNEKLRTQPGRMKERISTKFQLALANIGLNNTAAAKSLLMEIYSLDPGFTVDVQQFSPKVITIANEAKTEQNNVRCRTAVEDARENLAVGDAKALLSLFRSMKAGCAALSALEPEAAELVFKKGLSDYRQGNLQLAVESFRAALGILPKHVMAADYLELAESKLQLAGDRVLLDWQKSFQTQQFKEAAAVYRQIASLPSSADAGSAQTLNRIGAEYRKALDPLVDSWNLACSNGDDAKLSEIRDEIAELLPDPTFGADIRSKMVPCAPDTTPAPESIVASIGGSSAPVETPLAATNESETTLSLSTPPDLPQSENNAQKTARAGCFQMVSTLALVRLRHRVEPTFSPQARTYMQNAEVRILVKVRIEENGSVTVIEATGANSLVTTAVRSAVEAWKFAPALDEIGPRCVDTEIPIVISRR